MTNGAESNVSRASQAMGRTLITELVRFNGSRKPAGITDMRHMHPFHQIDVVLDGTFEHIIEGGRRLLSRVGDAVLVPPLVKHRTRTRTGCWAASYKIYITGEAAEALSRRAFSFSLSKGLLEIVCRAAESWNNSDPFAVERVIAAGTMIILDAMACVPEDSPRSRLDSAFRRRVLPLLVQMELKPSADWTVAELARRCRLSVDHFSRMFRREVGQSPKRFIVESRMRGAAIILAEEPARSIKEISEFAGYSTVQAFSRAFRQAFGTSPAVFRRQPQTGRGPSRLIRH